MNRGAVIAITVVGLGLLAMGGAHAAQLPAPAGEGEPIEPFTDDSGAAWELPALESWTQNLYEEIDNMTPAPFANSHANRVAFLEMISACEGTQKAGGYQALYGSRPGALKTFESFADHPRIVSRISANDQRWTSAAGKHQFMAVSPIPGGGSTRVDTWDRLKKRLQLPDFSPESQDRAALELVRECGALEDVDAGRVLEAANKCRKVWASLPGANYAGQHMRSQSFIVAAYQLAGGAVA